MKPFTACCLLLTLLISDFAVSQSVRSPELTAMETFIMVQFQQGVGTVLVREYALGSTADESAIVGQVETASALVSENALVHARFGLHDFNILQERMTKNRGLVTGEYVLGRPMGDKREFLRTLFSTLLQAETEVTIDDDQIRLQFTEAGSRVLQQNGEGVYQRGQEVRVIWPADIERLQLLIAPVDLTPDDVQSLEPWLSDDVSGPAMINAAGPNDRLQHDLDIARLNDLVILSGYIEAYREAAGRYPLQGESPLPHYSFIATAEQQDYVPDLPIEHSTTDVRSLLAELRLVLGDDLQLPFDPQRVPVNKPNFYVYMIDGNHWYLAVHLHEAFPFANRLGDYYYKLELTNSERRGPGQWLRSELLENDGFLATSGRTPHQPGYVQSLRDELGGIEAF